MAQADQRKDSPGLSYQAMKLILRMTWSLATSGLLATLFGLPLAIPQPLSADAATAPSVIAEPDTAIVPDLGAEASFTASADGSTAVQWQFAPDRFGPWTDIGGATAPTLTFTASDTPGDAFALGNAYRAVFSNAAGAASSRPATLVSRAHWMRDLGRDIAFLPLTELTIPGAHDMGTYGIGGDSDDSTDNLGTLCGSIAHDVCERFGKAQDGSKNAAAELMDGIRYFDLRVCGHAGPLHDFDQQSTRLMTCHSLEGAPLQDILEETRAFVDSHPGEVVVLDLNHHFELNPDIEAARIEETFTRADGSSRLIPPQYCTSGNPDSGTCAGGFTLHAIEQQQLGSVIVNFENDGAPGDTKFRCQQGPNCQYFIQPVLDSAFYDRHPRFWGRGPRTPLSNGRCTFGAAFPSCFGDDTDAGTVLSRVRASLRDNTHYAVDTNTGFDAKRFFVQFLQTTPDTGFILSHPFSGSLLKMARESNPIIGPALFNCSAGDECFGQFRAENLNVLAINFYNRTDYTVGHALSPADIDACNARLSSCPLTAEELATLVCVLDTDANQLQCFFTDPVHFDFVEEAIRFNANARTAPVVSVSAPLSPAATGWYNAAALGGQGVPLSLDVDASDFRYPTGIGALDCSDGTAFTSLTSGTDAPSVSARLPLGEGVHLIDCRSTDGAASGFHNFGHRGAGPGSTPAPAVFRVDTTPPQIQCPAAAFTLHQPVTSLTATVTDAGSGPVSPTVDAPVSTGEVGSFSVPVTAADVAGNAAMTTCSYTVSYQVVLNYDASKPHQSGSTVGIKIELDDFTGVSVGGRDVPLTATVVTMTATGASITPTPPGHDGLAFHVSGNGKYQFDLKTKEYAPGDYTLGFSAGGDPHLHAAPFVIR